MPGFGVNAIAVVTRGLKRAAGTTSFEERLVSAGLVGDITATSALEDAFLWLRRKARKSWGLTTPPPPYWGP